LRRVTEQMSVYSPLQLTHDQLAVTRGSTAQQTSYADRVTARALTLSEPLPTEPWEGARRARRCGREWELETRSADGLAAHSPGRGVRAGGGPRCVIVTWSWLGCSMRSLAA
jgi:hypothetical protein